MSELGERYIQLFSDIAAKIRYGTFDSKSLIPDKFPTRVEVLGRVEHMTQYASVPTHPNNRQSVVDCIASYWNAKNDGVDTFVYSTSPSPLSVSSGVYRVRNADNECLIDCSTLVGLALRGIDYEHSPYAAHSGANATWTPSSEIGSMYATASGSSGWAMRALDAQEASTFSSLGISGKSSIRNAADLAGYLHKFGYTVYDANRDGEMTASKWASFAGAGSSVSDNTDNLQKGDVVFWAKSTASDIQKARYRSISHVAIYSGVGTSSGQLRHYYYHATTSDGTVLRSYFEGTTSTGHHYDEIALIIRPNYGG